MEPGPEETPAQRLARLEEERDELELALPAHGLKPAHLLRIEALEEEIEELRAGLGEAGPDRG